MDTAEASQAAGSSKISLKGFASYIYPEDRDRSDIPRPEGKPELGGLSLIGGGTQFEEPFKFLIERMVVPGNLVVLRGTGDDTWNEWIYSLGGVDSVETLVISSFEGANNEYVCKRVAQAEGVFISGGDQSNYVNFWTNSCLLHTLQARVDAGMPIGGTSAGLAVLGDYVYSAQGDDSVTSEEALNNPYHPNITLVHNFLRLPYLTNLITDTHFIERKRLGRLVAFLARTAQEHPDVGTSLRGLGVDRESALVVETRGEHMGEATLVKNPAYPSRAYAVTATKLADQCVPDKPLRINGLNVYRLAAGETFNLKTFKPTDGRDPDYTLDADAGVLKASNGSDGY